jgi:cytochrome c oxidase assembly protein subunit 15
MVYGKVFPPAGADELAAVNHLRIYQLNLPWVTLGQIWVHYVHRILAVVVTVAVTMVIIKAVRMHRAHITRAAMLLLLLILSQLTLGALTVILQKPADIASLHVAVGALTLMTTFIIAIRAARLYSPGLVARPEFKRVGADASVSSISKAVPA